jgi:hypothetical protein
MHYRDRNGPICGVRGDYSAIAGPSDLREVKTENLQEITCKNCAKKLVQWGFAIQHFAAVVQDVLSK